LGWFSRDHRKLITIDHSQAFISGLCIGDAWIGNPEKKIPPWRDTGVEIFGPAVADVEAAFAAAWKLTGGLIPLKKFPGGRTCRRQVHTFAHCTGFSGNDGDIPFGFDVGGFRASDVVVD